MEESLWVTNRFGEKLEALLRKPSGSGLFPTVVFVSGFGVDLHESRNSNDEISKLLAENGFCTLQFSFAGRGNSQGDYLDMTLERQVEQLDDVMKWVTKRTDINTNHIGVHAKSFGCPTAMVYLLTKPKIKAACFVSGAYDLSLRIAVAKESDRIAYQKSNQTYYFDPFDNEIPVGPGFRKSIAVFDPVTVARRMSIPVLMIHGGKDSYVQTGNVREVFDSWRNNQKELKVFRDGNHGITDVPREMREEFLTEVVKWFQSTL